MTDLHGRLAGRIQDKDLRELCRRAQGEAQEGRKEELYRLIGDEDDRVAYNSLWVWTHLASADLLWLSPRLPHLMDRAMAETHSGKKRLLLTLLERLPFEEKDLRTDFLDFCLRGMLSPGEPPGCKALCIKLAYKQCRYYKELRDELTVSLGMLDECSMSPGVRTARKNVLKKLIEK